MPVDMSAVSVMIATPHIGAVDPQWLGEFMRLEKPKAADGSQRWFRCSTVRIEIASARNMLATMFVTPEHPAIRRINDGQLSEMEAHATHLLFWDDDVLPPPDGLMRLLAHDLDIVSGFYTSRTRPVVPVAMRLAPDNHYQTIAEFAPGLQEVDAVGAGFLLIKRRVFDEMDAPWFQFICHADIRRNVSEDVYFCRMAQKAAFKIWLDFDVQCLHIGQHSYGLADCIEAADDTPVEQPARTAKRTRLRRRRTGVVVQNGHESSPELVPTRLTP